LAHPVKKFQIDKWHFTSNTITFYDVRALSKINVGTAVIGYIVFMKSLTIADASTIVLGLQDEIRRSEESRYDHRLHGVLLVVQGMSCPEGSRLWGDSPRTVEYWVRRFEDRGLAGLVEGERSGRPRRLNDKQLEEINSVLRQAPESVGIGRGLWDGKGLATFIKKRYGVTLGVRQCQYIFRSLGFRRRKPRPLIARADPELQEAYKKTPRVRSRS